MVARVRWDDKDQDPSIPSLELLESYRRMIHSCSYNEYAMTAYDLVWDAMFYTKPNQCNLHNDTE